MPGTPTYYMGEYNLANGQLQLATQQLELALASPDLTVVQRKRFQARPEGNPGCDPGGSPGQRRPRAGYRQQRRRGRLKT